MQQHTGPRRGGVTGGILSDVAKRIMCCHLGTSQTDEDHLRKIWDRIYGSVPTLSTWRPVALVEAFSVE